MSEAQIEQLEKVEQITAGLTVREKVGQLNQRLKGWEAIAVDGGRPRLTDTLRAEVDRFGGLGALYGLQRADPWSGRSWRDGVTPELALEATALVQDHVRTQGSSGLPVLFVEEAPHGLQALGGHTLPVNLAQGATFDTDLVARAGAAAAAQIRARGIHVALLSGLDMLRDPRWGRAEECFSEDPLLSARMVEATVRGMQRGSRPDPGDAPTGTIAPDGVAVVVKHLAAQGAGIGGRNGSGAPLGPRELHELHLPAAHAAARAGVAGYMAAYNDIDGVPCCGHHGLLTGVLREQWGWDGLVMADGTAIDRLRDVTPDPAAAAALALRAGVDLSLWDEAYTHLSEALDRGLIEERDLDRAVARVLGLKQRVGLLDDAPTPPPPAPDPAELVALGAQLARESVVLLRTREDLLPIRPGARVAVVGPNADQLDAQLGDYTPPRPDPDSDASTIASALREQHGAEHVVHAAGSALSRVVPGGLADVARAAAEADVCVVVLGGSSRRLYETEFEANGAAVGRDTEMTSGEGIDLADLELGEHQLDVARTARASGTPVIGVLLTGRPHAVGAFARLCDALVFSAFPGPSGGEAVASVLTGREIASGLLPVTLPGRAGTYPVAHDERRETSRGYADVDPAERVLLGAGLRPAGVEVTLVPGDIALTTAELAAGAAAEVEVVVRNAGERACRVAVPLYGRVHRFAVRPRVRRLVAFRSIEVPSGAQERVTFRLGLDALGSREHGAVPEAVDQDVELWLAGEHPPVDAADRVRVRVGAGWVAPTARMEPMITMEEGRVTPR
ncbi:glycoside hydrolase family 3 N-terminal domain-containing protein [Litorihabitans aurantiacus]|uniref:Beta-glucosidase n=1 Tax=Litorihabitans aurantiacus TaxID=1930061 RepID=A0AA37XFA6_9MICO|nr:glycoside hydrolase family 3 N-terminal domain-containing protein [Litorihabitans aurantiacus]GMA32103.1 beta-glucosidase [Litorihabitans aurantiacus]